MWTLIFTGSTLEEPVLGSIYHSASLLDCNPLIISEIISMWFPKSDIYSHAFWQDPGLRIALALISVIGCSIRHLCLKIEMTDLQGV